MILSLYYANAAITQTTIMTIKIALSLKAPFIDSVVESLVKILEKKDLDLEAMVVG
jgi:hypothetical protein